MIEAFRSTLEEVVEADLILHVLDGSSPEMDTHMGEVLTTLERLNALHIPRLTVLNKMDAIDANQWPELSHGTEGIRVSARTGEGLRELMEELDQRLFRQRAASSSGVRP